MEIAFSKWLFYLVAMGRVIKEKQGADFKDIIEASIAYALAVGKRKAEDIIAAFSVVYPNFKDTIMTAAKQLEKRRKSRCIF